MKKKRYCSDYKKKTVHHQRQRFSGAAPQPITTETHHREDMHISPTERSTILHQRRSQPRHKYTPIYCLQQPAVLQPQQVFVFSNPNQCYKPSAATTTDSHLPAAAPAATPPSTVPSPSAVTTNRQALV